MNIDSLPYVLKAIIKALGILRAQEFLIKHGGTQVFIPKNHSVTLGLTDFELKSLRAELNNYLNESSKITLPKVDKIFISFRNFEIQAQKDHHSIDELAKMYNLTSRHILNILKQQPRKVSSSYIVTQRDIFE